MTSMADEMAFNAVLRARGMKSSVFDGLTTSEQRKEAFRKAIQELGPCAPAGKWDGMERTAAMVFQLLYREPL